MDEVDVPKPSEFTLEQQRDRSGGSMAMLGDDQIGTIMRLVHALLPGLDLQLDDPDFIDKLNDGQLAETDGVLIRSPGPTYDVAF